MMVYGQDAAKEFLADWFADKSDIVLITGRSSYEKCGAAAFLSPFLSGKRVTHLTTVGENPQIEDVKQKQSRLPSKIDAFIAVGGGTVIDTAKLLRAFSGIPFLVLPTTAGTGAEATRFAVYYDHGKKCSADDLAYLPTDQVLIPEFCESASSYQKACCAFDAYAQAVESLWAKRATPESQAFARKALSLSTLTPQPQTSNLKLQTAQLLSSYYAGRAIDISRTTAAHAFSYYMTSTYGVPHGEAVYMMFPYICRANGHEEYIRTVPELRTLDQFIVEKNLNRAELIDRLFENVNPARLGNNPCLVTKDHFCNL